MKSSNTAERLKEIMDKRGLKQVDVLRLCAPYCRTYNVKLGKTALSQYLSGRFEPRQDKLTILGLALNVSEAWLMGFDVPMERSTMPAAENYDGRTKEFADLFTQLTEAERNLVIAQIKGILSSR